MTRLSLLTAVLVLSIASAAAAVPRGGVMLVDRPSGLGPLPYDGSHRTDTTAHALSADGCFVVFSSRSDDLLTTDENAAENVYRQNRCMGTPPVQVNTSAAGVPAAAGTFSGEPTISADGRFVAFLSNAENLHPDARGAFAYVFVKDMATQAIQLASRGSGAAGPPAADPFEAVISGNGGAVLFKAVGAVGGFGDPDDVDLYLRSLGNNRTNLVSVTTSGERGGGVKSGDIDYSGRNVAFITSSPLDPDADSDTDENVYLGHLLTIVSTSLVSPDRADEVAISSEGRRIAYTNDGGLWVTTCPPCGTGRHLNSGSARDPFFAQTSTSAPQRVFWKTRDALDPADHNAERDIYSAALAGADQVRLVTGGLANGGIDDASATDDGALVIFSTGLTTNLPGSDGTHEQVYVRTTGNGVTTNLTRLRPSAAGDAEVRALHALSDDGRLVAFRSAAPGLGATVFASQVFARDVVTGTTTLVSVAGDGRAPANRDAELPSVDAAGRRIAFTSGATNLVSGVTDGRRHVYVRDLVTRTTLLVDHVGEDADHPQISGNGTKVVFEAAAGGGRHIYRADLATGATVLVDRATGGATGDGDAFAADINLDGNRIAFTSEASNLGGAPGRVSVYVRDIAAGTTTWASVPQGLNPKAAFLPSLSGDGRRVAFLGLDGDMTSDPRGRVFVRDLTAGTTTRVSPGTSGFEDDGASLSRDGRRVAFTRFPDHAFGQTFVRDLATGSLVRADVGRLGGFDVSLSGNGACVAYGSGSDDVVRPTYGPDFDHVFLRALNADCPAIPPRGAPRDTVAPVIRGLHMSRRKVARGRRTAFVFRVSERARTRITIRRGKRVITLSRSTRQGLNRIRFRGRVRGRYRARVVATDVAGNRSKAAFVRFRVSRGSSRHHGA